MRMEGGCVADLMARPALAGLDLPLMRGAAMLGPAEEAPMLAIAPFRGRDAAVAAVLGADLPGPGGSAMLADGGHLLWAGIGHWLLRGAAATEALADRLAADAAAVDVSDGWAGLILGGDGARDVLARLLPLDLDPRVMPAGRVARSPLRHVPCLMAVRADDFLLLVPRSYAGSAVADLARAMEAVAARARR
jgi:heterotetrameric sarcosine oxidase gamma subunit